jgi:hypothetical protein
LPGSEDRWEAIAAKMDEELARECTGDEKALEPSDPSACDGDSRGGTRTLDPGIMRPEPPEGSPPPQRDEAP